jgi:hypothetical protein
LGSQIIASLAAAALVAGGFAAGSETRSMAALPSASPLLAAAGTGAVPGDKCQVEVIRAGTPGLSAIVRDSLPNGVCVCRITTGPSASNGSAESVVAALLRDRECADAPAAVDTAQAAGQAAGQAGGQAGGAVGAAGGGGGLGGAVLPVVFGVGAIGLGVGLGSSSKG